MIEDPYALSMETLAQYEPEPDASLEATKGKIGISIRKYNPEVLGVLLRKVTKIKKAEKSQVQSKNRKRLPNVPAKDNG